MFKRLFILLGVLLAVVPALAQNAPDPINAALQDLSTRINRTVTLSQVAEWNYQQSVYPSPALGCPQAGVAYADVVTSGYQFIITYDGTVYDYRVSDDKSIVVLCGTAPAPATVPPCPPPNDSAFLAPRLSKGIQAQVIASGLPNVIRQQPGSSSRLLGQIPAGDPFIVIDGPRCTVLDKIVWWQINYNNLIGWTGEGKDGTYWLEPTTIALTPTAVVPENVVITATNAGQLTTQVSSTGSFAVATTKKLYASVQNNDVVISDFSTNTQVARFSTEAAKVSSLAFNSASTVLAAGMANGEVRLFDLKEGSSTPVLLRLTGHTGAVLAIAFSPDGTLVATGGEDKTIRLWDSTNGTSLATLTVMNAQIKNLAFTADGVHLIASDQNGNNVILAVKTGTVG